MIRARHCVTGASWLFDDVFALVVMLATFTWLNVGRIPGDVEEFLAVRLTIRNVALAAVFMMIWHSCFAVCGLYRSRSRSSLLESVPRIIVACTLAAIALSVFT